MATKPFWNEERLDYVREKLGQCALQRADVAAGLGLTPDEFEQHFVAGCAAGCAADLRELAKCVVDAELECKEGLINTIKTNKVWNGAAWLLERRFRVTWGKDAKAPNEGFPPGSVDWFAELDGMLAEADSPLVQYLATQGFIRPKPPS